MIGARRWGRRAVTLLTAVLVGAGLPAAAGEAAAAPSPCGLAGVATPATYDHVVVIFEENSSFGHVIGNANAPYLNQLAGSCALATNYNAVAGVSQPNYMAATSGVASGVGVKVSNPSIFQQVPSWLELQESMGGNCGGKSTFYKRGHDPAFWYTPIAAQCKTSDIPAPTSNTGITNLPALPAYTFITPNLCHNNHWLKGCPQSNTSAANLKAMDTWLQGTVQTIAATASYQQGKTLILISFDESSDKSTTRIPMVAVAGGIQQPVSDGTAYDTYALLRASEEALGIQTFLGQAATANSMRSGMHF
jgi:phosphatidylinositol-3-phosphatase